MLYVPIGFEISRLSDALVKSRVYVSATSENEWEKIQQQSPNKTFKIDDWPPSQKQVANCQLEKLLAIATIKFDFGDNTSSHPFSKLDNESQKRCEQNKCQVSICPH